MADDPSAAVEPERRGACTPTDALPQMPCDRLGISDGIVNWQVYAVVSNKYFNVSLLSQSFAFTYVFLGYTLYLQAYIFTGVLFSKVAVDHF